MSLTSATRLYGDRDIDGDVVHASDRLRAVDNKLKDGTTFLRIEKLIDQPSEEDPRAQSSTSSTTRSTEEDEVHHKNSWAFDPDFDLDSL
ncbi:hypothetical protein E2562_011037 [Oryza meyeriana var. granulata]|uniref:Uncharacterized protein n=1 Tax=Oryza meyeriana var. granulata TaxID=110450 RepID=A0A6G1EWL1_9ORYZ|nr:hypothetical protein E2562_011037 [Oryza meyeriana var. granulata]